MIKAFASEEEIKTPSSLGTYTYKDILNKKFKLVNQADSGKIKVIMQNI